MPSRPCVDCGKPGTNGRCQHCARRRQQRVDDRRGTPDERGYDAAHRRLRADWAPKVATGLVQCARCGQRIRPGQSWALDHTDDRRGYLGPSCAQCNSAAGGRRKF